MSKSNPGSSHQISAPSSASLWPVFTAVLIWILSAGLAYRSHFPPRPLSPTEPSTTGFSAWQADEHLQQLVGDGIPHPAGSPQNGVVRQRIVKILESSGYEVELQSSLATPRVRGREPVTVTNVLARLPGTPSNSGQPRRAIALVAHYDSHPATPGASDDGVGVAAVLEIARLLKLESDTNKFQRDILILITDGEEFGLLGARQFLAQHPAAEEIAVVINLEGRGSSGSSLMFQTGSQSRWLIQLFGAVCNSPKTSSLFDEVYRRMPNDTDFTVFKEQGIQGYNFAFIGDVRHYHTPQDTYENVDRGSLQHHGDNALSLVRALANLDLGPRPAGQAVYFDFFSKKVVWWPSTWSLLLSLVSLGCTAMVFGITIRQSGAAVLPSLLRGPGIVLMAMLLAGVAGELLAFGFGFDNRFENPWPDSPLPIALSFWLISIATAALVSAWLGEDRSFNIVALGVQFIWSTLAIVISFLVVGGSYLFIVPAIAMSAGSLATAGFLKRSPRRAIELPLFLGAFAASVVWFPTDFLFYDAIGFKSYHVPVIRTSIVTSLLLPLLFVASRSQRLLVSGLFLGATIVCLTWAVLANPAAA